MRNIAVIQDLNGRKQAEDATAAMISTTPIDTDMIVAVVRLCFGIRDRTQMVSTVAGTDPAAKSPATRQSTLPFLGVDRGASRFRHGGVKQVGSHRRERMDAEK
jgi:hypothetical protein